MKTSSSVILIALAVADSSVLLVDMMQYFLEEGFEIWIEEKHKFICKSYRYIIAVLNYTAIYYLVIFTIFRVISVYLPHKSNVYCTKKRAFFALTATFIIMCLINKDYFNIQYIILTDEKSNVIEIDCWFVGKWAAFYQYYAEYVSLCLRTTTPFSVLIVGNSMIIYRIRKSKVRRQQMTQTANQSTDDSQSMTAMLISISLLFLVTQTPFLITNYIEKRHDYDTISLEYEYGYYLLETFTRLLKFVNNVANFFCYCVSGKMFKSELIAMMKEWLRVKDAPAEMNSSVTTTTSTMCHSRV